MNRRTGLPHSRRSSASRLALLVASTNAAGAHLSERRYYYSVPVLGSAEWVLIDRRDPWIPYDPSRPNVYGPLPKRLAAFERSLQANQHWRVVFEQADVVLYRRDSEAMP